MPSPVYPSASAEKVSPSKPPAATRPTISKPVLQTTTPNATNLIGHSGKAERQEQNPEPDAD